MLHFGKALLESKEQAKLENQLEAMQRKLKAMEEANALMATNSAIAAQNAASANAGTAEVREVVVREVVRTVVEKDDTSGEIMALLSKLRVDNEQLRRETSTLRDENASLKRKVADLEAGQSIKSDWLAAARSTINATATANANSQQQQQQQQQTGGDSPTGTARPRRPSRASAQGEAKTTPVAPRRPKLIASNVSRFQSVVGSFFGGTTPHKEVGATTKEAKEASSSSDLLSIADSLSSSATVASSAARAVTSAVQRSPGAVDKRRAPHIALPLNRFWQDIPAGSLGGALPRAPNERSLVHLKVGGQYLCATGPPLDNTTILTTTTEGTPDPRYLRCEPPCVAKGTEPRAVAASPAERAGTSDAKEHQGYRAAMAFRVERVATTAQDDGSSSVEERLSSARFRLRSELTGGYVVVGGLFQRYCLVASATKHEAATFEFVARRKAAEQDDLLGAELAVDGDEVNTALSMEQLRARQLLVALRVADGPKAGHFVRVRPDAYVNVAPPASVSAARGSLSPDDRATPLLSVELLVPLSSYEITFVSSQLGLIVSKTMPLRVVRFKEAAPGAGAPAAELTGRIGVGDILATADGKDLLGCSRRDAVDVITSSRPITIGFRVARLADDDSNTTNRETHPVSPAAPSAKQPTQPRDLLTDDDTNTEGLPKPNNLLDLLCDDQTPSPTATPPARPEPIDLLTPFTP